MNKILLTIALFLAFTFSIKAQNSIYLTPLKYTATGFTTFNQVCYQPNGIEYYLNGVKWVEGVDYTQGFCAYGICQISFPFGSFKVGDTFEVRDNCGSIPATRVVEDDYVYVEAPGGTSYISNGIGPNDENPPYSRLSNKINIGKCEPININSHGLHTMNVFVGTVATGSSYTSGEFLINGNPIKLSDFNTDIFGNPNAVAFSFNANGSITYNSNVGLTSKINYSGRTPFEFEYRHNGVLPFDVQEFTLGALGLRIWSNTRITVKDHAYTGTTETEILGNYTNSIFKFTYDGANFQLYIDGVLIKTIPRTVIYSTSSGTISNPALLPYGSAVTWTPSNSGNQWVNVIVDGVLITRQQFLVVDDMVINETITNVACAGGSTGNISVNVNGGKIPLQYAINSGAFGSISNFSGLSAGSYTVKVKDASGCITNKIVTVGENPALNLSTATKVNANCNGDASGAISLSGSGGIGTLQYSSDNVNFQNSNIFSGLTSGNYTFWLKDAAGCTKTLSETIGTNSTLAGAANISSAIACNGSSTGAITITTSGIADGPIQYSIDGSTFQNGSVFSGLTANIYAISIKDNSCTISLGSTTLTEPTALTIAPTIDQNVSCFGGVDGKITVSASGGTGTLQYSNDGITYSANNVFASLMANSYKFWVKDANGCIKESNIVSITEPTILAVAIKSKTDVKCNGQATGSVDLLGSGGTSPYSYSKDGTNFSINPTIANLIAGTYTFTIKDTKGCLKTVSSSILESTAIVIAAPIITNLTCNGDNSGQIVVSATGGVGPYTFSKDNINYQNSGTFSALAANNYTIYAKDVNNCVVSVSALVTEPTLVNATIVVTNNLCKSDQTGKIVATGTGGTGPYQYSKDGVNFLSSGTFSDLLAGTYSITTKDSRGCLNNQSIVVNEPPLLTATSNISNQVTCFGGNDGTITITATGGTTPFQYSSDGITYQNSAAFSFAIGTYNFWVKDNNGCITTTNAVTLTQPTVILPSQTSISAVSCFGGSNGSVTISATGGVAPYTYSKDGVNFQGSGTFSGFSAGVFILTVKDNVGCIKPISIQILQPAQALAINAIGQNLSCFQNNSGIVQATLSGGTAAYEYSKDNATFQSSGTFTDLAAGNYTIYGRDINGCTTNTTLTLTQPTDIITSLIQKLDVNCETYTNGFFKVSSFGGTGSLTYNLSGTAFNGTPLPSASNTTGLFENLKIGNYIVRVSDQSTCSRDFPLTIISKNSPILFDIVKNLPTDCITANGSITLSNIRGGQGNYSYFLSGQTAATTNPAFSNLANGSYFITASDNFCDHTEAINLELPNSIKATYTINPISCQNPNANLTVDNITGGNGNYNLAIDGTNFSTNRTFNNLSPNIYAITIQDSPLSCKSVVSVQIKEQNRADLKVATLGNISCFAGNNGFINAIGDNNLGPFNYAYNNGAFSANGNFTGLSAGTYKITAQTRIGCLDSIRVTLSQPSQLQSTIVLTSNLCFGDQTGKINVIGSGGVTPYQYTIDAANYQSTNNFLNLTAGTYNVTVKDANNCTFNQNKVLTQPTLLTSVASTTQNVSCFEGQDGKAQVIGNGGVTPYTYAIDGTTFFTENNFNGLVAANYTLIVKDANGCVRTSNSISVTQPTLLVPSVSEFTNALCNGSSDGSVTLAATGGTSPYFYSKDNATFQNATLLTAFPAGNFTLYVKDNKGCVKTTTQTITQPLPILLNLVSKKDLTCFENKTGEIVVGINGGTQPYRYSIDNNSFQNTPTFSNLKAGNYTITGKDFNNCTFVLSTSVSQPEVLNATFTTKTNDCFGDKTGNINAFATGGTVPYQFALDANTFQATSQFDNLLANTYSLTIKDKNACSFTKSVTVTQPDLLVLNLINQDLIRCFGEANGSILVNSTGGTPGFIYSLDNKIYENSNLFQNLKKGKYQIFVKDAKQCLKQSEIELKEPDLLTLTTLKQANPLCAGEQNGIIEVKALGGNGGYEFIRDNSEKNAIGLFEKLSQAEYTFKVLDSKKCEANIEKVVLKWPKPLSTVIEKVTTPKCFGDVNGAVQLSMAGGISPYSGQLLTDKTTTNPLINNAISFENLASGKYSVKLADVNGCELTIPINIPAAEKLAAIDFTGLPKEVCKGQEVALTVNNPNQKLEWYLNGILLPTASTTDFKFSKDLQELSTAKTGKYTIIAKNISGCEVKGEYTLINNKNALKADFLIPTQAFVGDTVVCLDITKPVPDRILWKIPTESYDFQATKSTISLVFVNKSADKFTVEMKAFLGECVNIVKHEIKIFDRKDVDLTDKNLGYQDKDIIENVEIFPNPNNGRFVVKIKLTRPAPISMQINRQTTGENVFSKNDLGKDIYIFDVELNVFSGLYLLTIKSERSTKISRIYISK